MISWDVRRKEAVRSTEPEILHRHRSTVRLGTIGHWFGIGSLIGSPGRTQQPRGRAGEGEAAPEAE